MNPIPRILIVDDDERMARTLSDILKISGYETMQANSGLKALELTRKETFDCVLTDVRMPNMNGVEFYQQLRQERPGLPVVLMTAYAADEIIRKGLEEGVVGVFDKPLDITYLLGFFASLARSRIVAIVDDDPQFCRTLSDILEQRGFNVSIVSDPHADVSSMAAGSQVILLDMKLNSRSGLDVLRDIRAQYPDLPVLLITGYRDEMTSQIQAALDIHAFACLYKPLEIPELLETLERLQLKRLRSALK